MIPVALWASALEDVASANAAVNGKAQIKAEQKCRGYHAHTTKIDAERVRQWAKQLGLRYSVMCLVEEQENNADGHRNDGKQSWWSTAFHGEELLGHKDHDLHVTSGLVFWLIALIDW